MSDSSDIVSIMENSVLDEIDLRLLAGLQEDASLSQAELARRVAVSPTSCWRRIRVLEETGVLEGRVALVNARAVGLGVNVVANVSLREHTDGNREAFEEFLRTLPEVVECFSMTGDRDYLLRVVVPSVEDLAVLFPDAAADAAAQTLLTRGARWVACKRGDKGASFSIDD